MLSPTLEILSLELELSLAELESVLELELSLPELDTALELGSCLLSAEEFVISVLLLESTLSSAEVLEESSQAVMHAVASATVASKVRLFIVIPRSEHIDFFGM